MGIADDPVLSTVTGPAPGSPDVLVKPPTRPSEAVSSEFNQTLDDYARAAANAFTYGGADRLAGGVNYLTGKAPSYSEGTDEQVRQSQIASQRSPVATLAGDVTGGAAGALVTGGPLRAAITSVPKLGPLVAGTTLAPRLALSTIEGALQGGAQGAGHTYSGKPIDYLVNAGENGFMGGLFGLGGGAIGSGAGGAYTAAGNRVGYVPQALAEAAQANAAGLRAIPNTPNAMLPDAGPSILTTAQGYLTGATGSGRSVLYNNMTAREAGRSGRLLNTVDQQFGRAINPQTEIDAIEGTPARPGQPRQFGRMDMLGPDYEAAFNRAQAVDTEPLANRLDGMIPMVRGEEQAALMRIRNMLNVTGTDVLDPHPRVLQAVRAEVRDMSQSPDMSRRLRGILSGVYADITDEMHRTIPGIRELDSQYAELARQAEALTPRGVGASIFDTGKGTVYRPAEFQQEMNTAAQPKGTNIGPSAEPLRMRQAARAEIDRALGTKVNDVVAVRSMLGEPGGSDWNAQKLETAFGAPQVANVRAAFDQEVARSNALHKLFGNPPTADRLAAANAQKSPPQLGATTLTGLALSAGNKLLRGLTEAHEAATANRITTQMAETDPVRQAAIVNEWLNAMPTRQARADALRHTITNLIIGGGAAANAPQ